MLLAFYISVTTAKSNRDKFRHLSYELAVLPCTLHVRLFVNHLSLCAYDMKKIKGNLLTYLVYLSNYFF